MSSIAPPAGSNHAARRPLLSKQLRNDLRAYAFLSPWIFSLLVFTAYPTLASFYFAMTKYDVLNPPRFIGFENFITMFTRDPLYWVAVWNTFFYTIVAVPLSLLVALLLALLLNQRATGIGIYRTIFYLPAVVPAVAAVPLWVILLDPRFGLVNTVLGSVGLPQPGWLKSADWAIPGLILMSLWAGTGSAMLIFLAGLKDVPQQLLEAATIDGANGWQRFRHVTLPLITPTIYFNLIIGLIASFQIFGPAFFADSIGRWGLGPLNSLLMYMLHLYRSAFRHFDMGYASAMALVLFVVLVALTLLLVRTARYWVYYEGEQR
jgi:multiple sugar transport system permease protein